MIKCVCYNHEKYFKTRKEARKFFIDAYCGCDYRSHEAQRYLTILEQLENGLTECTDN